MSQIPEDLRYAQTHEWIRLDGSGIGTVGITDHAQAELTDIVYVEVPKPGTTVGAGDQAAVVESVKAASDIYSPVAGEIIEGNEALDKDPGLVNRDPFGAGWIFKIRLAEIKAAEALSDASTYRAQIGE